MEHKTTTTDRPIKMERSREIHESSTRSGRKQTVFILPAPLRTTTIDPGACKTTRIAITTTTEKSTGPHVIYIDIDED